MSDVKAIYVLISYIPLSEYGTGNTLFFILKCLERSLVFKLNDQRRYLSKAGNF